MAKNKAKKSQALELVAKLLNERKYLFSIVYKGLDAEAIEVVRKELRNQDISLTVSKNTLTRKALADAKVSPEVIDQLLDGQIALVFGQDGVEVAKSLKELHKTYPQLEVVAGLEDCSTLLTPEQVSVLADLPSREQLLAQLAATIAAPLTGTVRTLAGNLSGLVNVLNNLSQKTN
ncbi:50S ribosomal protein L10 [Candidatus Nomurabacteria bacterium]|nr:50S ribosomal protein L10 [Candidatus Nomurabacteria bacterium]